MKQILAISLVLCSSATAVAANIYDDCERSIKLFDAPKVNGFASTIRKYPNSTLDNLDAATLCVSAAEGVFMTFIPETKTWAPASEVGNGQVTENAQVIQELLAAYLTRMVESKSAEMARRESEAAAEAARLEREAAAETLRREQQAAAKAGILELEAARRERQEAAEAERLELESLQSKLEAELAKLEEHSACISSKTSQLLSEIETIDKQNNDTNNSLIINDTYSACSELYLKDKSSVMVNQSCIDAFKLLGHPNFIIAGDEMKSSFMDQLGELSTLRANLVLEQNEVGDELRTSMGFPNSQDILSAASEAVEEKSCAEFGYEGVYRD